MRPWVLAPAEGQGLAIVTVLCSAAAGSHAHARLVRARVLRRLGRGASLSGRGGWCAPPEVVRGWEAAGLGHGVDRAWTAWLIAMVLGPLAMAGYGAAVWAVVLPSTMLAVPAAVGWALRDRRRVLAEQQLPAFLDAVARGVRSGLALQVAFVDAAARAPRELAAELVVVGEASRAGTPFPEAVARWRSGAGPDLVTNAARGGQGSSLAGAAVLLVARFGGSRAAAVEAVARTLRERQAVAREAHALATQARLSAVVIVVAPVVFGVFVAGVDAEVLRFLVGTPLGWGCLSVGLGLDGLGAWWMARLSRRSAR